MYAHVHVCACTHIYTCVCHRFTLSVDHSPLCFLRQNTSPNLELTDLATLTSQPTTPSPGFLLSGSSCCLWRAGITELAPPPWRWESKLSFPRLHNNTLLSHSIVPTLCHFQLYVVCSGNFLLPSENKQRARQVSMVLGIFMKPEKTRL